MFPCALRWRRRRWTIRTAALLLVASPRLFVHPSFLAVPNLDPSSARLRALSPLHPMTASTSTTSVAHGKPIACLCLHLLLRFSTCRPLSTSSFFLTLPSSSFLSFTAAFLFTRFVTMTPLRPFGAFLFMAAWGASIAFIASIFAFIPATSNSLPVSLPHVAPLGLDSVVYAFVTLRPGTPFLATHQRGVSAFIAHLVDWVDWLNVPATSRSR